MTEFARVRVSAEFMTWYESLTSKEQEWVKLWIASDIAHNLELSIRRAS